MRPSIALCALFLTLLPGCHRDAASSDGGGKSPDSSKSGQSASGGDASKGGSESSAPVDTVKLPLDQQRRVNIAVMPVTVMTVPRVLAVAGQVAMDEKRTDHLGALADGRVERVFVLPGDRVRAGQELATIHSHSVHETVGALAQAYAALDRQKAAVSFATQNRDRYARLLEIQAASVEESQRAEQQLQQAKQDYKDADASVRMEREHLSELLQVPPDSLTPNHLYDRELVPIRALTPGSVITRDVTPGQVVTAGQQMFTVSDLSTVWVTAAVNERDLPAISLRKPVRVLQQSNDATGLAGTVTMLGDVVDPQTRTVPVRISVPNPTTRLRPGMFVTAQITEASSQPAVFVPEDALQEVNGLQAVFTTTDGETFHVRSVTTGNRAGGMIQVQDGLRPGDRIVVRGAFMVKSELLKGSVGEG